MDFVVVATADWDNPLWTNKQHLSSRWGRTGHRVLYVESLGLRRPSVSGRDLRRMWRRLSRAHRLRQVSTGVWVLSPLVIPVHDSARIRRINRRILRRRVRSAVRRVGMRAPVLWTYNPLSLDYLGGTEWSALIYHCVDELAGAPGIPPKVVERSERELCRRADLVIVSAAGLASGAREEARRLEYFPNVADFDHFHQAAAGTLPTPADVAEIRRPRIGFVGSISDYKIDLDLLREIFEAHPDWSLVLVGPVGEGDPDTRAESLASLHNVHFLGVRAYDALPGYLASFDVCLLPNRINRYTRHMFPLKFFEYLATGRPVVMSPLPSLDEYRRFAYVADGGDAAGFASEVEKALAESKDAPVKKARIEEARQHDWGVQAERLATLAAETVEARRKPDEEHD